MLYIGSYTRKEPKGIYEFRFDRDQQKYVRIEGGENIPGPSYLILSPNLKLIYSVSESEVFNGRHGGGVMSFERRPDGSLHKLDERGTERTNPCHLCIDRAGKRLFAANYSEGAWNYYPVEKGRFLSDGTLFLHQGSSVNPARQECAHVHFVMLSENEKYLWTVDLGKDQLVIYSLSGEGGAPEEKPVRIWNMTAGHGPRHLIRHPGIPVVYAVNELASCITVLGLDEEGLPERMIQEISILPEGYAEGILKGISKESTAGAIKISADGRFVYATNRGDDSIAVLAADGAGRLTVIQHIGSGGRTPRDLTIAPTGDFLYCANQDSDLVTGFLIGQETGMLQRKPEMDLSVSMPVCVLFAE